LRLPLVAVGLRYGARRVRLRALIDSGADASLLDASHADALGLDRASAERIPSVGADGTAFKTLRWPYADLELEFGGESFPFRGAFFDVAPGSEFINLMGRADFFERFIVQFWDAAGLMNIDLSPDFVRPPVF
jgi:hypothetical protein